MENAYRTISSYPRLVYPLIVLLAFAASGASAARPNVIIMMADDMGLGDCSAYQDVTGNQDDAQIHTPNMERLARRGVRFTDAHSSSSRCTNTRYGLLTGRYAWRNRMKWWVLFGAQGDPMIEGDRPTVASMLRDAGYRTGMVGKWHVGLRYRKPTGEPAAAFTDADLTRPLWDTPLDHGFDFCRYTSRSHATSGPQPDRGGGNTRSRKRNRPDQTVGPGHLHGRDAVGATGNGRKLVDNGAQAYVLDELGGRHSDHAMQFLKQHVEGGAEQSRPFFLYYASNSNHSPYTPDKEIGGEPVEGAGRTVSGLSMNRRSDFIYENDVALGRLLDFLDRHDDPRAPGNTLASNTIVVFTSDNGAEITAKAATGPFRSNKGSAFEGGHRIPFLVAWPAGKVGDADDATPGGTNRSLLGLHDLYATLADALEVPLPDLMAGEKGAEDSRSKLAAWRGEVTSRGILFHNDHKESEDPAVAAIRCDDPVVGDRLVGGQWKMFFTADLIRFGEAVPTALYELRSDPLETENLLESPEHARLVAHLTETALLHRRSGGHRWVEAPLGRRISFDWRTNKDERQDELLRIGLGQVFDGKPLDRPLTADAPSPSQQQPVLQLHLRGRVDEMPDAPGASAVFATDKSGLGLTAGESFRVDSGEELEISFSEDVVVESLSIIAGDGQCGGSYAVADKQPLAIYCIDADVDSKDQHGVLSDIGLLREGETLRLDSSPHLGVEAAGAWRLGSITVRTVQP